MSDWRLRSLDAFDEPITFHTQAQNLYSFHADEIVRQASPLIEELRRGYPVPAAQLEQLVQALSQRFRSTADNHGKAVEYHATHKSWHADTESTLRKHIAASNTEPPNPPAAE